MTALLSDALNNINKPNIDAIKLEYGIGNQKQDFCIHCKILFGVY